MDNDSKIEIDLDEVDLTLVLEGLQALSAHRNKYPLPTSHAQAEYIKSLHDLEARVLRALGDD